VKGGGRETETNGTLQSYTDIIINKEREQKQEGGRKRREEGGLDDDRLAKFDTKFGKKAQSQGTTKS